MHEASRQGFGGRGGRDGSKGRLGVGGWELEVIITEDPVFVSLRP